MLHTQGSHAWLRVMGAEVDQSLIVSGEPDEAVPWLSSGVTPEGSSQFSSNSCLFTTVRVTPVPNRDQQ
jgi:hypothetical protein